MTAAPRRPYPPPAQTARRSLRRAAAWLALLVLFAAWLAACAPAAAPTNQTVIVTAEGEKVIETVVVEKPAEAARTEAPAAPAATEAPAAGQPAQATAAPAKDQASPVPTAAAAHTSQPPVAAPTEAPAATQAPMIQNTPAGAAESQPPTSAPTATAQPAAGSPAPAQPPSATSQAGGQTGTAPPATPEAYLVQVDWPARLRLGESDVVRLALVPVSQGYAVVVEYPEHAVVTQTVAIQQSPGYDLFAVARLDGVGFDIAPAGDQPQFIPAAQGAPQPPGQRLEWRWSLGARQPGRQRLMISLHLRWIPLQTGLTAREVSVYSQGLETQVNSFLGLTQAQAALYGLLAAVSGGFLCLAAVIYRPAGAPSLRQAEIHSPNTRLAIELPPGLSLAPAERSLLQAIFRRYQRLVIEREFLSGYSGARAFLALPVRADGRADAYTIAKLGDAASIQHEFENYETFVKDTLPPITARIQHPPVSVGGQQRKLAALQYTFIGEQGRPPVSLRQALLDQPDPALLTRLVDTFGPNWWLQRRPYTFRLGLEYDRLLPTHLVIEPAGARSPTAEIFQLDGRLAPGEVRLQAGALVRLSHFPQTELRADGQSLSLQGATRPGQAPLRVRWLSAARPDGALGRVAATRLDLLRGFTAGCDLGGLPDPLLRLPALLEETIAGSQSTVHGDLNLENVLIGPGGMLWLIDFARTRDGHTLFDFAHLRAELVAHVLAPQIPTGAAYLELLQNPAGSPHARCGALLNTVDELAARCLLNPARPDEYRRAAVLASLGALKYANMDAHARCLLYLTAAHLCLSL